MKSDFCDKHVLSIVCNVFDAYSVVLFLPGDREEECELVACHSQSKKVEKELSVPYGKGLVGWILRNQRPLLMPKFDPEQHRLGYYSGNEEVKIKAFMGCPVPGGGALCVDSTRPYAFSDKDHVLLQLFAELFSITRQFSGQESPTGDISRYFAALGVIQDMRFSYKRWPVFLHNFLRAVAEASGFDYCAFASIAPGEDSYIIEGESARLLRDGTNEVAFPINNGVTGWALRNEMPVFSSEEASPSLFGRYPGMPEFQSVICLPVIVNKSAKGAICLGHTMVREVDEPLRAFLRQSVDYMALFLENLYLRNRMRDFMQKATLHTHGPMAYNPDTAPMPVRDDDD